MRGLKEEGFRVAAVERGRGPRGTSRAAPGRVIVDIGLPDADGRDVVQALRAQGETAPVIFLTARGALPDRLSGFAAGGDDYLTKPFAFAELVARLHALVKRGGSDLSVRGVGSARSEHPRRHVRRRGNRSHADGVPAARAPRRRAGSCRAPEAADGGRLGARGDRPRQHPRRVYRPAATQARAASGSSGDRDRARGRVLPPVTRPLRLGVRTRLLLAAVGAVALALVIGVTAFNSRSRPAPLGERDLARSGAGCRRAVVALRRRRKARRPDRARRT